MNFHRDGRGITDRIEAVGEISRYAQAILRHLRRHCERGCVAIERKGWVSGKSRRRRRSRSGARNPHRASGFSSIDRIA
ncbi:MULTISPECIES: hypothetical protein [unclassified Bradyrhizobium]|uniref:hypothetical protein n=1 Tax=unclassified Bradyrhizobium TaxID=2631580 RepID=UPI0029169330|nr:MULTISPECIES: hypothetical protein [unclassified Bradyrhizobium]